MVTELALSTGASETEKETLDVCTDESSPPPQPANKRAALLSAIQGKIFMFTPLIDTLINYSVEKSFSEAIMGILAVT